MDTYHKPEQKDMKALYVYAGIERFKIVTMQKKCEARCAFENPNLCVVLTCRMKTKSMEEACHFSSRQKKDGYVGKPAIGSGSYCANKCTV